MSPPGVQTCVISRSLQEKRISCVDALYHPFLEEGRIRYHSFLCSCCHTTASNGTRHFCRDFEPSSHKKFDPSYEKELTTITKAKGTYSSAPLYTYSLCLLHRLWSYSVGWFSLFRSTTTLLHHSPQPPPPSTVYKHLLEAVQAVSKVSGQKCKHSSCSCVYLYTFGMVCLDVVDCLLFIVLSPAMLQVCRTPRLFEPRNCCLGSIVQK